MHQHATGCANGRNMQHGNNDGSFWPKMLRPFVRGLTITVTERKSVRIGLYRHEI